LNDDGHGRAKAKPGLSHTFAVTGEQFQGVPSPGGIIAPGSLKTAKNSLTDDLRIRFHCRENKNGPVKKWT
jgi:hypothetical protein